ncbi:hypothetical protein [Ulvibacterium sp.]|uniref:hypothetical protein n=1 Tax=Ulvibacterium sp. TaxID=2665914 RepID=UPI003BACD731
MKSIIFSSVFLCIILNMQISKGQEAELVASYFGMPKTITPLKSINAKTIRNNDYLKKNSQNEQPLEIVDIQREAANFNLTSLAIYNKGEKSTYDVVIKSLHSTLYVKYDHLGNIISSTERHKNLKIPIKLSQTITREYPGWGFTKSNFYVKYRNGKPLKGKYYVLIRKGKKSKSIQFNIL